MMSEPRVRSSRTRRKSSKAVDYSADPFSDEDLLEEDEKEMVRNENPVSNGASSKRGRKPRKSEGGGQQRVTDHYGYGGIDSSAIVYTEKNYDSNELPLRERFTFSAEFEADGSPKIECIIGRRIRESKRHLGNELSDQEEGDQDEKVESSPAKTRKAKEEAEKLSASLDSGQLEYEYLVKYKGVSYLHLEWKLGTDLESMNKSAKTIYRRFLKKLEAGTEEGLEDPTFDPGFIDPQKIVDEQEQEIEVEMTDKEIIQWEKEQKLRRLENGEESDEDGVEEEIPKPVRVAPKEPPKEEKGKCILYWIMWNSL